MASSDIDSPSDADSDEYNGHIVSETCETQDLPITVGSCVILNHAYKAALTEFLDHLKHRLAVNRARQEELTQTTEDDDKNAVVTGNNHPNSMLIFYKPYFKDVKTLSAPPNDDVITKERNGEINQAFVGPARVWTKTERKKLVDLVTEAGVHYKCKNLQQDKNSIRRELKKVFEMPEGPEKESAIIARNNELKNIDDDIARVASNYVHCSREESRKLDWSHIAAKLDAVHDSTACELKWINEMHPEVNTGRWTPEEDTKLVTLVQKHGKNWKTIAEEIGNGRITWQVALRFQSEFNNRTKRTGPFSKAEAILVESVIQQCQVGDYIPWHQVNYYVEGRSQSQVKHFWQKVNNPKRGWPWTEGEDKVLAAAVKKYGIGSWNKVAFFVYGRNNRQCRERYMMRIVHQDGRKLGDWTKEEDMRVVELAHKHNFKWVEVEKGLKGRNARQVASRYDLLMKWHSQDKKFAAASSTSMANKVETRPTRKITVGSQNLRRIKNAMMSVNGELEIDEDMFLRQGRLELKLLFDKEIIKLNAIEKRGRKKKNTEEDDVDNEIVEMFSYYSMFQRDATKKMFSRSVQDQYVVEAASNALRSLMEGKKPDGDSALDQIVNVMFKNHICDPARTSLASTLFPPNRATVRAMQGILLQRDYLAKRVSDSTIITDPVSTADIDALERSPAFQQLFKRFLSLFYYPAVMSKVPPPDTRPQPKEQRHLGYYALRDERAKNASKISSIRDCQKVLINTSVSHATIKDTIEMTLDNSDLSAKWYVKNSTPSTPFVRKKRREVPLETTHEIVDSGPRASTSRELVDGVADETPVKKKRRAPTPRVPIDTPRQSSRLAGKRSSTADSTPAADPE